jgi:hypothetical protein
MNRVLFLQICDYLLRISSNHLRRSKAKYGSNEFGRDFGRKAEE